MRGLWVLLCSVFSIVSACANDDLSSLKKYYYENGKYQEYDGGYAINKIELLQNDINNDGLKEVLIYHSTADCGSSGCTGVVYSLIDNRYCAIGGMRSDEFDGVKNTSKKYRCLIGDETAYIENSGLQSFNNSTTKNVENDLVPDEPFKLMYGGEGAYIHLAVVSKVDDIKINGVEVNRGNCVLHPGSISMFPADVKFGQALHVAIMNCTAILEVRIMTNYRDYTYSMQ